MTIEQAAVKAVIKPWGVTDLSPWSGLELCGEPVGELWFRRADSNAPAPALMVKLLFTSAALSIQVHPDDEFARSVGLPNGKTEAWYILEARPGAQVALGLKQPLTSTGLRTAIRDGSIATLVQWIPASKGDIFFVPAGTIHAIGAGIILAEIQQRSDTTFRLFDYGSTRELHEDSAVAASKTGPIRIKPDRRRLGPAREVLVTSPHFVMERIELPPHSRWTLRPQLETWILATSGDGRIGSASLSPGGAVFAQAGCAPVRIGPDGMSLLIAYPGPHLAAALLQQPAEPTITGAAGVPKLNEMVEAGT